MVKIKNVYIPQQNQNLKALTWSDKEENMLLIFKNLIKLIFWKFLKVQTILLRRTGYILTITIILAIYYNLIKIIGKCHYVLLYSIA